MKLKQIIYTVLDENGQQIYEPRELNTRFLRFYSSIYQKIIPCSSVAFENFISGMHLPTLSRQAAEILENPLTLSELLTAIKEMSSGKAPGMDGLPAELYRIIPTKLVHPVRDMFLEAFERGSLPDTLQQAVISIFLKPGKNDQECCSYRPISLLNMDNKILASVMARRLKGFFHL